MKQVTGSNPASLTNKVSIQLALDGHSFSVTGLEMVSSGAGVVEVVVLTPRTVLAPAELCDASSAEALLASAGVAITTSEQVIWSDPHEDQVAVMAVDSEVLERVSDALGERLRFTSPLLHAPQITASTIWILRTSGLLYIKVYREGLQFAEVIPAASEADLVYLIERLNEQFLLKEFILLTAGNDAVVLRKQLGKRFKQTLCE